MVSCCGSGGFGGAVAADSCVFHGNSYDFAGLENPDRFYGTAELCKGRRHRARRRCIQDQDRDALPALDVGFV